ncbi:hypothetical protein AAE026_06400 [Bradyrhizobium sp. DN5]|uniref:hypothetical protein n=1 Tax=Bradyrhizobium sp. DN5 TaxID=3056950 RepID=UPI003523E94D
MLTDEGKIGIGLALVGLGGAGAIMVAPEQMWIGWTMIAFCASGGAMLILYLVCSNLRERKGFVLLLVGTALIISGAVLGLVGAMRMDASKQQTAVQQKSNNTQADILFDCHFDVLPRIGPPDGKIQIFEMPASGAEEAHLINYLTKPAEQIDWHKFNPPWSLLTSIYRCDLTAIKDPPIFEASFNLEITYYEAVPYLPTDVISVGEGVASIDGKQLRSGNVVRRETSNFKIRRLDAATPYTFYIANRTRYFATVRVPKDGSGFRVGRENETTMAVGSSSPYEMFFSPVAAP